MADLVVEDRAAVGDVSEPKLDRGAAATHFVASALRPASEVMVNERIRHLAGRARAVEARSSRLSLPLLSLLLALAHFFDGSADCLASCLTRCPAGVAD